MRPVHVLQLLVLAFLWGSAYLFMRASVPSFGAGPMVFMRMALGSTLVLLPLALWRCGVAPFRTHWRGLLVFGLAFTVVPFLGLGWAAKSISAGMLAVLQSAAPLFAAIVGRIWVGEPITRERALGLLIGFVGVAILVWDKAGVREEAGLAILLTLFVTALWGVSSNYARTRLQAVDPFVQAAGSIGVAALALAPLALATWPEQPPGAKAWAEVIFLGVASSGAGFLLYFSLLRSIGPVRATSVTFLSPLVAIAAGAVYLGEEITLRMLVGCAVILVGTALTLGLLPWRRPPAGPRVSRVPGSGPGAGPGP
ncbi:DMT family transporter [Quisquiliibacterium transsilvanicum]|uniref:Drug/metabolite transporter (DMT)-like permease n=1 Tax=Quisquiliibacterium transsilvanicum TaxID=1549638 RepID=A0A7W8HFI3_9BURK|nr:DMT family transporter [Quisquiliibacterium transsilvanicum]MBB5271157.1 drug/metabolite transporter (DMT)-like permease [Quisquiliibacterium transsilvanicum]